MTHTSIHCFFITLFSQFFFIECTDKNNSLKKYLSAISCTSSAVNKLKKIPVKNKEDFPEYMNILSIIQREYLRTKDIKVFLQKIKKIFNEYAADNNQEVIKFQKPLLDGITEFQDIFDHGYMKLLKNHLIGIVTYAKNNSSSTGYMTGFPFQVQAALQLRNAGKKVYGFELAIANHTSSPLSYPPYVSFDIICANNPEALILDHPDHISINKNIKTPFEIDFFECKAVSWATVHEEKIKKQIMLQNNTINYLKKYYPLGKYSFTVISSLPLISKWEQWFQKNGICYIPCQAPSKPILRTHDIDSSPTSIPLSKSYNAVSSSQHIVYTPRKADIPHTYKASVSSSPLFNSNNTPNMNHMRKCETKKYTLEKPSKNIYTRTKNI